MLIMTEFNEIETRKTVQRITKSRFFRKMYKIDKLQDQLTKSKKEMIKINRIRNEHGDIMKYAKKFKI